jgi:hypothetical protein
MHWPLASLGALLSVSLFAACNPDEGAPDPAGIKSSFSSNAACADGGGGPQPNGAVGCNVPTDCQSGTCFLGMMQHFCTIPCSTDTATQVCVAPLTGTCNKQGFCKRD